MSVAAVPDLRDINRLLIIRLSSIGDVVHALPVAAALKDSYPHLELTWIVEEMSSEIVTGSPCLSRVIVIPRSRWKKQGRLTSPTVWREYFALLRTVRSARFDLTLDLQGYAKSALLALASGARYRYGWNRLRDGSSLVSRPLPPRPNSVHRVDLFLDAPAALGVVHQPVRFPLYIPDEAVESVSQLLVQNGLSHNSQYAVLNPAVGSPTRKWSAESYAELAVRLSTQLGLGIVLVGSNKDKDICGIIVQAVCNSEKFRASGAHIADLSGATSLKQLAAVLNGCTVHVCGDTGSAHIAAALRRPVVALYGPTDPAYAGPWNQTANVLARREFCIEGCGVRGCAVTDDSFSNGQIAAARCLSAITPEEVMVKVSQVIDAQA